MRKALKAVTLMGLAAALIVPAAPSVKAADMDMGSTKVTIGGQLRERLEWWAQEAGTGKGSELGATYRARLNIKAQLSDGITAVFVPQAYGIWGESEQGFGLGENSNVGMHEAYMLLANPFGIDNLIVKLGRQEVNLGNQRLVGSVGWSQAGRSLDGILVGYAAGNYGLVGFFYGKLNEEGSQDAWFRPKVDLDGDEKPDALDKDIDLYVATWQGNFKPFGIGGTYEITDIYVNPTTNYFGKDADVNTIYGRVTPTFNLDMAKVKVNFEGAYQSGDYGDADFGGYFFSVGAGAGFDQVTWAPSVFIGYDYYSGDDDAYADVEGKKKNNDIDAFWSVLPTAHKWLGHSDALFGSPFYAFNKNGLVDVASQNVVGVEDLYLKLAAKPFNKLDAHLDLHYFQSAEDVKWINKAGKVQSDDDIGWEADFAINYRYSKNLCLSFGYDYFDPDDAYVHGRGLNDDDAEHHIWAQADLKF